MMRNNLVLKDFEPLWELFDDIKNNRLFQGKHKTFYYDLPGGRWSGKTFANERLTLLALFFDESDVDIEIFRYFTKDKDEMWNSIIEQAFNGKFLEYFNGNKFELNYKHNRLRCDGVKSTDPNKPIKLGRSQRKCKYKIIWIDEFYEFTSDHWDKLKQALRNYKYILIIKSANPWIESQHWVKDCYTNFPPNIEKLMNSGSCLVQKGNRIVHWTNALINWKNLPQSIKDDWIHYRDNRPSDAKVVCYGLPGSHKGAVFSDVIGKISAIESPTHMYIGGLDYGYIKDKMVALFGGTDAMFNKLNIIDEYVWDNFTQKQKDPHEMSEEIVDFYLKHAEKYRAMYRGMIVYCDNSERSFIDICNKIAMRKCLGYTWLSFKPCTKLRIVTRTDKLRQIMSENRLIITPKCVNLWMELKLYAYDQNKDEHNPIDKYNHSIDAMCYLLTHWWRQFDSKAVNNFNFAPINV